MGKNVSTVSTVQIGILFKSDIHVCRFKGGLKVASLKSWVSIGWHPSHLERECGASLKAQELTREKKVDMGENLFPRRLNLTNHRRTKNRPTVTNNRRIETDHWLMTNFTGVFQPIPSCAKLTNYVYRTRLITLSTDKHYSLDSEDDFHSGCRNVSHQQQFFSELPSPGRSPYTNYWYSWIQTIYYERVIERLLNALLNKILTSFRSVEVIFRDIPLNCRKRLLVRLRKKMKCIYSFI